MNTSKNLRLISASVLLLGSVVSGSCFAADTATGGTSGNNSSGMSNSSGGTTSNSSNESATAGQAIDDAAITTKVKAALLAEPDLKSLGISVETVNGVVKLTGSVDSFTSSNRARTVAGGVAGVRDVDNQLVVKK